MMKTKNYTKDGLGDRQKRYEYNTRYYLTKKVPVIIRLDGRAFHSLTKQCQKPFDVRFMDAMSDSCMSLIKNIQGAKAIYTQSDEATILLTDYEDIKTGAYFDYNLSKILSIVSSTMSVEFNKNYQPTKIQVFDARAFNIPREDVVNNFLWRAQDWNRNSIQMYAQANFSQKQLHKKNKQGLHDILHTIGKNWTTDLTDREKNGRFIIKQGAEFVINDKVLPTYESIAQIINPFLK